ncbi:hypothetical protein BH20ACT4_BH20ACT4_03820 [soil metagenome]
MASDGSAVRGVLDAIDHHGELRLDLGKWVTETLFATANGYIGMRANPLSHRDAHPRRSKTFEQRVLVPALQRHDERRGEVVLGYRCANSRMTMACAYRHVIDTACDHTVETQVGEDLAKTVFTIRARVDEPVRLVKLVSYHSSTGVPTEELGDRRSRSLQRVIDEGIDTLVHGQRMARRVLGAQ